MTLNKITSYIYLDIESRGYLQTVKVTDQDNGIQVVNVTLFQNGTAYALTTDVSIAIRGKTPAGEKILDAATAKTDYSAEFTITEAMSATAGRYLCSIQLTGSNSSRKVIPAFYLLIEKDPVSDSDVEASSEFTALSTALEQVSDITDLTNRVGVLETDKADKTALSGYMTSAQVQAAIDAALADRWKVDKPVGCLYMSFVSTSPATLFGGSWTQLKDRFLLSVGDTYKSAGLTGGEADHTLTVAEMPSHRHKPSEGQFHSYIFPDTNGPDGVNSGSVYKCVQYTDYAGGGGSHNNMPPYITVYVWRRIA